MFQIDFIGFSRRCLILPLIRFHEAGLDLPQRFAARVAVIIRDHHVADLILDAGADVGEQRFVQVVG